MLKNANNANKMLIEKSRFFFECKNCDYNTSSKKDFDKHNLTLKHKKGINANDLGEIPKKNQNNFSNVFVEKYINIKAVIVVIKKRAINPILYWYVMKMKQIMERLRIY